MIEEKGVGSREEKEGFGKHRRGVDGGGFHFLINLYSHTLLHMGPLDPVIFKEATLFTCIRVH